MGDRMLYKVRIFQYSLFLMDKDAYSNQSKASGSRKCTCFVKKMASTVFTLKLGCSYLRPSLKPHVNVLFSTRVQEQEGEEARVHLTCCMQVHLSFFFFLFFFFSFFFFLLASAPFRCSTANQCINRNHCLTHLLTSCIWDQSTARSHPNKRVTLHTNAAQRVLLVPQCL